MFNRYFNTDGNLDFVYANIVVKNIYFAQISLNNILYRPDFDVSIYHDEHTYYFFHLQSILTACGNISNVFYNKSGSKTATERSRRLRQLFNVNKSIYPLVFQKEVRNTNAHFDERYEAFNKGVGDYNLLDRNTDTQMRDTILNNPHLRTYDKENNIYYTYNYKLRQIEYDLNQLQNELINILQTITENDVFNSSWVYCIPEDVIINDIDN